MAKSQLHYPDFSDYAPVADRVALFYERFPSGRIVTRLHSRTSQDVTFVALVFRDAADAKPAATGWASERQGDGEINAVACLENTETSAVGRALANLGFTASTKRPSREEMAKVTRERTRLAPSEVREPEPGERHDPIHDPIHADALQWRADAVSEVLELLDRAEAGGFPSRRATSARTVLLHRNTPPGRVMRFERRLRAWMARHRGTLRLS